MQLFYRITIFQDSTPASDIIVVLIILVVAGFLIYNRIGVIMDYPARLADAQQAKAPAAQEIEDGETLEDTENVTQIDESQ